MQSEGMSKIFEIAPGWAAVIAGSAQAIVLGLVLFALHLALGSIGFLF